MLLRAGRVGRIGVIAQRRDTGPAWAIDATAAAIRSAMLDPASYASGGWRIPGTAGARIQASARASVAMQQRVDGAWEFAAHNLLQRSDNFSDAYWTKVASSATGNRLQVTSAASAYLYSTDIALQVQRVTMRIRAKAGNVGWGYIQLSDFSAHANGTFFNLATGALGTQSVSGTNVSHVSATTTVNADGTVDCALTLDVKAAANYRMVVYPATADQSVAIGVGQYIDLSFANLSLGTSTVYVPTTTTAVYAPAIDWLSDIGAYGLRSEEARTNLLLWSADLSQAATWLTLNAPTVGGAVTSPDGTLNARSVTFGVSNTSQVYQLIPVAAGARTLTVFARSATSKKFRLKVYDGAADIISADFQAGATWQRFSLPVASSGASANAAVMNEAAGGTGTVEFWCPQLEQGAFATSPILTFGAAATRAVDAPIILGGALNQAAGTLIVDALLNGAAGVSSRILAALTDGTIANYTAVFARPTDGQMTSEQQVASALVRYTTDNAFTPGAVRRVAVAYQNGELALSHAGRPTVVAAAAGAGPAVTRIELGAMVGGANLNGGGVVRIRYAPQRLPDATLQSLTAASLAFDESANTQYLALRAIGVA
ncbi:MAG: hypothetical protein RJA99_4230 [Pseudomonadota bacterium]|jgi:hypothetical protein